MKLKRCKQCKLYFQPVRAIQPTCSFECAVEYANAHVATAVRARAIKERKLIREAKDKNKSLTVRLNEAQAAYNKWRRLSLLKLGYGCISCGTHKAVQWHCGHYRTRKAASQLRFGGPGHHNCWLQCSQCNNHDCGNIVEYRKNLRLIIGDEALDALESNNEQKRWTVEEAIEIKKCYLKLVREMEK